MSPLICFSETREDRTKRLFRHYTVGSYDNYTSYRYIYTLHSMYCILFKILYTAHFPNAVDHLGVLGITITAYILLKEYEVIVW